MARSGADAGAVTGVVISGKLLSGRPLDVDEQLPATAASAALKSHSTTLVRNMFASELK
jgi:hypothetical protein